jgi:hypothetical protein
MELVLFHRPIRYLVVDVVVDVDAVVVVVVVVVLVIEWVVATATRPNRRDRLDATVDDIAIIYVLCTEYSLNR